MRTREFAAAYALDWCIGDPEWMPHPVRLIGWGIEASEGALRRYGSGKLFELTAGATVAIGVPTAAAFCAHATLRQTHRLHPRVGTAAEIWLASTCLATRNLLDEAQEVIRALEMGEMDQARLRLARIVGRNTNTLDEAEICRALVETLAESLSDGIVAPLLYLSIGGVPLAMAYKAVNTLDSMIGHKDETHLYFGRVSARMDDIANYIPARISALLLCLVATWVPDASGVRGWRIWRRDGGKHVSPNAGQVEAAIAGLCGVRLGGTNRYGDEVVASARLGDEFPPASRHTARRAWKAVALASLLGFAGALFLLARRNSNAW
jgi:adenosylcobinamide-phosphate synthase